MLELKSVKRLSLLVNTVLLGCFVLALVSFRAYGMPIMFSYCIPTLAVIIALYIPLARGALHLYVSLIYIVLTAYMAVATVCLGYDSGFHLYSMSMIPLAFYFEYMGYKLGTKRMSALLSSLVIVVLYLLSTGYAVAKGPVYSVDAAVAARFLYVNATIVFGFLISYANLMLKLIVASEDKLTDMAHKDRLTGLFNRHYMTSHLEALYQGILPGQWIAMVDIDDFKAINDTYGHSCGDYVLTELTRLMQDVCSDCTISRWGGEEFLIISNAGESEPNLPLMEELRRRVESARLRYEDASLSVTVTVGVACYQPGQSLSSWIQRADSKLYEGKEHGKNRVVC